jgi:tetratricopeptide (TPR) repeat protein
MTPEFRELILEGGATPVSQLSSAFLTPKSPMHLQFAYFESSLVVEYLIEKYGIDKLRAVLDDLGEGRDINEALVLHTEPLNRLDADFANYLRQRAERLAIKARWEEPELPAGAGQEALVAWIKTHPNSVPGLKQLARIQLRNKQFEQATETAKHLQELFPADGSPGNAFELLAAAYRGLGDDDNEREALEQLALRDDSAVEAYLRLMELAEAKQDWGAVSRNAHQMLAVNPLVAAPYRYLARAAEELGQRKEAIVAYRSLLEFDTTDIAETHYRLGLLLRDSDERDTARRHVLLALEEAPRFLDAHRLLLELNADQTEGRSNESPKD